MFNLGRVCAAMAIPSTSLQREKLNHGLQQFSPSTSSLPQLWGKKTLNNCFFLVLLDGFVLCSLTRVNNTNCELGEQAGEVVSQLRVSPGSWRKQVYIVPGLVEVLWQLPLSLCWPSTSISYFASSISSPGKDLLVHILRGCNFPWTWWVQGIRVSENIHIGSNLAYQNFFEC